MIRKSLMFVFGLLLMMVVVGGVIFTHDTALNKDRYEKLEQECFDLGLPLEECANKLIVKEIDSEMLYDDWEIISNTCAKAESYPVYHKVLILFFDFLESQTTNENGVMIYKCYESPLEVDEEVCPFGLGNNNHDCYLAWNNGMPQNCENSTWVLEQ